MAYVKHVINNKLFFFFVFFCLFFVVFFVLLFSDSNNNKKKTIYHREKKRINDALKCCLRHCISFNPPVWLGRIKLKMSDYYSSVMY